MRIPSAVQLGFLAVLSLAAAANAQSPVRGVFRVGLENGGEKVLQFEYSDGTTPDVPAGGGLLITGGLAGSMFERGGHALDAQVSAGLKYRTIPPATNQDVTWLRFPVEGMLFYRTPVGLRFGAGAAVHLHNVMAASGAVVNDRVSFRNKPGMLLQTEYVRRNWAFDLRYTAMTYEVESGGTGDVGASSFGVGASFFVGRGK